MYRKTLERRRTVVINKKNDEVLVTKLAEMFFSPPEGNPERI